MRTTGHELKPASACAIAAGKRAWFTAKFVVNAGNGIKRQVEPTYQLAYLLPTITNTSKVFGIKYRNEAAYNRYRKVT